MARAVVFAAAALLAAAGSATAFAVALAGPLLSGNPGAALAAFAGILLVALALGVVLAARGRTSRAILLAGGGAVLLGGALAVVVLALLLRG
ncbi:hypothetical protein BJP25_02130 [Actinokineospora bangkokensis]|uniref:Major facilitator superfamily (MFS) profile domain-containing protein n=1 Tax=Actinokineospora bangkokensis TaxID=1193682 RepID=A0A1Q9LCU7_9PSEU|nr:hypothetical protein BJP25_02130 [Actinokineospora bangkokensis]